MTAVAVALSLLAAPPPAEARDPKPKAKSAPEKVAERPDRVSALLSARQQKSAVEITGERTETTSTWANPDGTFSTQVYSAPVRAWSAQGQLVPIDLTLVEADGKLHPKASSAGIELSAGGEGPFGRVERDGRSFEISWPAKLGKPEVAGDTATYKDAVPGGDLVVQARKSGLRYDLVLRQRPQRPLELRLPIKAKGLRFGTSPGGGVVARDAKDRQVGAGGTPRMWDAAADQGGTESTAGTGRHSDVAVSFEDTGDGQTMVIKPDQKFLADPATQYPVRVDPTLTVTPVADTYATEVYPTTSYAGGTQMEVGTWSGPEKRRAFIKFDTSALAGKNIQSAQLAVMNVYAKQCGNTGVGVQVRRVTSAWDAATLTWNNQPTTTATGASVTKDGYNFDASCPQAQMLFDTKDIVQAWASGTANHGFALQGAVETDVTSFRTLVAGEGWSPPALIVTYSSSPNAPHNTGYTPYRQSGATNYSGINPALYTDGFDDDGGYLRHDFEVSKPDGTILWTGSSKEVPATAKGLVNVPAGTITDGMTWRWRVRSFDGVNYGPWTGYYTQTADGVAPNAPGINCGAYWQGVWRPYEANGVTCTVDTTSTDGQGYRWALDDPNPHEEVDAQDGASATFTIKPKDGWHVLYVLAQDGLGNLSPVASYSFGAGPGGLISPKDDDRTQQYVALAAQGDPNRTGVTYKYRPGHDTTAAWTDIPAGDVSIPGTAQTFGGWPQTRSNNLTDFSQLNWNVVKTLTDLGKGDGPVEVKACYTTSGGGTQDCTEHNTLMVERKAFNASNAVRDLGPGSVALQTGDFSITSTDSALGDMLVQRGHTTLAPPSESGVAGVFGPGWQAAFPAADGVSGSTFEDHSNEGYVQLNGMDGTTSTYMRQADGTFKGTGDAADADAFTKDSSTQFTHTDSDGVKTVFSYINGAWGPTYTDTPGDESTVTYVRDISGRVTHIIGKVPTGVTCSSSNLNNPGCVSMRIVYSTDTTATGIGSGWGSYNGTVDRVEYTAYDPETSAMKTTTVSQYAYDSTGHLRQEWDARINPALKTTYYYNGEGRISQITPPGQASWQITYDGQGRLADVSRTDEDNRTSTETIVYDVPISGGPIDLTSNVTSTWAQTTDLPVNGAAVFPSSHVPPKNGSTGAYAPASGDWKYASLSYQDVNGRTVNTAEFGAGAWQITATRNDNEGRVVWELSAENRAQALAPTGDTDPYVAGRNTSAERADLLATVTTYNEAGDKQSETGPTHRALLVSGTTASMREHTNFAYDEGKPDSSDYYLLTMTKISPIVVDGTAVPSPDDTRITKNGYSALVAGDTSGWELRQPTSTTVVTNNGADLVRRTRYDHAGQVIETRQPASDGNDAGTTLTTYYTAGANTVAACGNKPEWAGQACRSGPKTQPAGKSLPITTSSYGYYGQVTSLVEVSGSVTRTISTSYDQAGRPTGTAYAVVPEAEGGQTVPSTTITYNATMGLAESTSAGAKTIGATYDAFGRIKTYSDGMGGVSTTTYTIDGHVATFNDGKGTYTYTYDGNDNLGREERRGLVTRVDTGLPNSSGVIRSAYNGNGQLAGEWYEYAQMWSGHVYDNTGAEVQSGYGHDNGPAWLWFNSGTFLHGQIAWTSGPGGAREHNYDGAGRLVTVRDTYQGSCTTRTYAFDLNTNRTAASTYGPAADGKCTTGTAAIKKTSSYDTVDRITDSGYTYDSLGRTSTIPAADVSGGGSLSVGYYANDMVASLTQGSEVRTFTLDPERRIITMTKNGSGTLTNHYATNGDSPAWIAEADGTWTRNISVGGGLGAIQRSNGTVQLQLSNLHGDTVATVEVANPASGISAYFEQTEYGAPRTQNTTNPSRYGWLGEKLRSSDALAGVTLMGVRLYNPSSGRFLSTDPVPGGNANAYEYCSADPVNCTDLSGKLSYKKVLRHFIESGACASIGVTKCPRAAQLTVMAAMYAKAVPGSSSKKNAIRHFIWQASLTFYLGYKAARRLGHAHEVFEEGSDTRKDQHNNAVARNWAVTPKNRGSMARARSQGGSNGVFKFLVPMGEYLYTAGKLW